MLHESLLDHQSCFSLPIIKLFINKGTYTGLLGIEMEDIVLKNTKHKHMVTVTCVCDELSPVQVSNKLFSGDIIVSVNGKKAIRSDTTASHIREIQGQLVLEVLRSSQNLTNLNSIDIRC